jgi:hypothetical protein
LFFYTAVGGAAVNVTRYALGVVVSTTCLVTGVLWYDRARPEIRAEDVATCIAAGVERKWVTDWIPSTNTVTSTIKASDLVLAATLLRAAITSADVIYLDPGTWSDGGLDMAYGLAFTNQCWSFVTNDLVVVLKTPESFSINGIALADKAMPVMVFTNTITLTTNQVYAVHTNLVIVSQTNTLPDWNAYGRSNGTVFVWNNDQYWGWCYTEASIHEENSPIFHYYDGQWATWTAFQWWQPPAGSPVGTYVSPDELPGSVEIGWHDSFVVTPLIITTNVTTTTYGGTNMPLYAALGTPANLASWAGLIGGTNSWWAYAGFGALPYLLQDVETISGRGRYTVEMKNLDQLRKLATNMVRTVDFDFAVVGTNRSFSGYTFNTNNYYAADLDIEKAYHALPALLISVETTNAVTGITGVMAFESSAVQTIDDTQGEDTIGVVYDYANRQCTFSPSLPLVAFTNGYIKRMRVYAACESRSPYAYICGTNNGFRTYEQSTYGENNAQTYGWPVTFGDATSDGLPWQLFALEEVEVGYLTTNHVWSLVGDVTSPTSMPVFVVGPTNLIDNSYFGAVPPLCFTQFGEQQHYYYRNCETRITHSALVIDWDFKLFGSTPYVPIETNRPAWIP